VLEPYLEVVDYPEKNLTIRNTLAYFAEPTETQTKKCSNFDISFVSFKKLVLPKLFKRAQPEKEESHDLLRLSWCILKFGIILVLML
jgi:hypothetical protein